jgi:hypothetical protein
MGAETTKGISNNTMERNRGPLEGVYGRLALVCFSIQLCRQTSHLLDLPIDQNWAPDDRSPARNLKAYFMWVYAPCGPFTGWLRPPLISGSLIF